MPRNKWCNLTELVIIAGILAALVVAFPSAVARPPQKPQQFVYTGWVAPNGEKFAILVPRNAVAIGVQSKSGPRAMVIGDVLNCVPFDSRIDITEKTPAGELPLTLHEQDLNCGPLTPGGEDRILAVVGLQWKE